ncbi:unnamed protein product [Leuciscus chuanchicus]
MEGAVRVRTVRIRGGRGRGHGGEEVGGRGGGRGRGGEEARGRGRQGQGDQGLRRQWIINIRRDPGRNFKMNTYTKVCSEHFLTDCLVKSKTGITKLKQGAVPTVFAWSSVRPERRSVVRTASHVSTDLDDRHGVNVLSEETPPPHQDHEYAALPPSLQDQLEEARKTIGFPDYDTFKAVFMALQPTAENMVGWSQAQRLKHTSGEKPSSKVLNSAIYSHYKGNTTFKDLIGIAPSEGDMVMADKGFLIKDLLSERQVQVDTSLQTKYERHKR